MNPRVVCLPMRMSVTLVHPAKAVERNEMSLGRDTRVVPSNTVLDRDSRSPTGMSVVGTPNRRDHSAAENSKHFC